MAERISQLVADLSRVESFASQFDPVEQTILNFTAEPEQITEWYFAHDPLQELEALTLLAGLREKDPYLVAGGAKKLKRKADAYQMGAAMLSARVFAPEAFTPNPAEWTSNLEFAVSPPVNLGVEDIMQFSLEKGGSQSLSYEEMANLYLSAEMLERSAVTANPQHISHYVNDLSELPLVRTDGKTSHHLADKIFFLLARKALTDKNQDLNIRFLGLDALTKLSASILNSSKSKADPEEFNDSAKTMLVPFIKNLEGVFLSPDGVLNQPNKNEYRGKLHELMWFLDSMMYLGIHTQTATRVFPADSFQDRPIIGKPEARRAFDFMVINTKTGAREFIQLKSRPNPRFTKEYHPLVVQVHEKNFMDINPRSLSAKLNGHKKAVQDGFREEHVQRVRKSLLPSVLDVLEKAEQDDQKLLGRTNELYGLHSPIPPHHANRAERRALRRGQAKKLLTQKY